MRPSAWLCLLLAGCVGGPASVPEQPFTSADVLIQCPTLPDGSPVACDVFEMVEATSDVRPSLQDGWKCTAAWAEDGVAMEQYVTADGRLGFHWEWQRWKPDGWAFQRLGWYTGPEEGMSYHIPYQESGFFAMPGTQSPDGPVEIQHTVRQIRVHALLDNAWVQDPDNVSLLLSHVGGDWWWAARFDWPGGPYFVDVMRPDIEEGQLGRWGSPSVWQGTIADVPVIIDNIGNGIKYVNVDFTQRRTGVGACALPVDVV